MIGVEKTVYYEGTSMNLAFCVRMWKNNYSVKFFKDSLGWLVPFMPKYLSKTSLTADIWLLYCSLLQGTIKKLEKYKALCAQSVGTSLLVTGV